MSKARENPQACAACTFGPHIWISSTRHLRVSASLWTRPGLAMCVATSRSSAPAGEAMVPFDVEPSGPVVAWTGSGPFGGAGTSADKADGHLRVVGSGNGLAEGLTRNASVPTGSSGDGYLGRSLWPDGGVFGELKLHGQRPVVEGDGGGAMGDQQLLRQ